MNDRARPPDDITPQEFFTRWVPAAVAGDAQRRARLGDSQARIRFELIGMEGGDYTVVLEQGQVRGLVGPSEQADLHVRLDVATWRDLNRGVLSAPEALLRRRVKLHGDLLLAIKLHFILG